MKSQLEIEELSDDPDDIAKVLLKLRHECERALENINQSINDGRSIVEHVTQGTPDVKTPGSCEHLEELISGLEAKKNVLETAWVRRREQMELWQQLWEFERDGEQVCVLTLFVHYIYSVEILAHSLTQYSDMISAHQLSLITDL